MNKNIFGWFDSATSTQPAFDPGLDIDCPFCSKKLCPPIQNVSLMGLYEGVDRSYFYRFHKFCYEQASPERITDIESDVIDREFKQNTIDDY